MNKTELDKILDRVRKLLALAGNNSNPHEAASAAEKAARILEEYNLTSVDIDVKEIIESPVNFHVMNTPAWYGTLAVHVANAFDCYVFKKVNDTTRKSAAIFVGTRSDAEVASYVYTYLFNTCQRLIKKAVADNQADSDNRMPVGEVKYAYAYGLMEELEKRIKKFYANRRNRTDNLVSAQGKTGKELMVIKENAVDAYLASIGRDRNYSHGRSRNLDLDMYQQGKIDAKNISLTYGIKSEGKGSPALLGGR